VPKWLASSRNPFSGFSHQGLERDDEMVAYHPFEVKWTKISSAKLDFYLNLVDYFFDDDDLHFRCVLIDKNLLNHGNFGQTHDDWYYKMLFTMLEPITGTAGNTSSLLPLIARIGNTPKRGSERNETGAKTADAALFRERRRYSFHTWWMSLPRYRPYLTKVNKKTQNCGKTVANL
jgi:hypothetical protein